jgi:hypothetical protein
MNTKNKLRDIYEKIDKYAEDSADKYAEMMSVIHEGELDNEMTKQINGIIRESYMFGYKNAAEDVMNNMLEFIDDSIKEFKDKIESEDTHYEVTITNDDMTMAQALQAQQYFPIRD